MKNIYVVIPNWNGADLITDCLRSLEAQTLKANIIVVDNGSVDESVSIITAHFPDVHLIRLPKNTGFAGGVNTGIRYALEQKADAVALFNNDAVAHKDWLKHLVDSLEENPEVGIATCKLLSGDKKHIDSTGDFYTTWGLPFPRGRDEANSTNYDSDTDIFGASGGASIYRAALFEDIGLFDEDFFAYYEDVDISFRAQLAGWKVLYVPEAEAYHDHGSTSSKISGFSRYQTFKNYPWLFWKNMPLRLVPGNFFRFNFAYTMIYLKSWRDGGGWPATKGYFAMLWLFPKKLGERARIQRHRKVSVDYINQILVHDLPPSADKLRKLRSFFTPGNR